MNELTIDELEMKINQDYMLKSAASYNLDQILLQHNKHMLMMKAIELELIGRSKMNKSDLIKALPSEIVHIDKLEETMILASKEEFQFIEKLLSTDSIRTRKYMPFRFRYIINRGLLCAALDQNSFHYFIPLEVKQVLEKLNWGHIKTIRKHEHAIVHYVEAAINLYGACTFEFITEIYNLQHQNGLAQHEIENILHFHGKREQSFYFFYNHLISAYFEEDNIEELFELLKRVENKPYYLPNKSTFIRYADSSFYELTPQLLKLKQFLFHELNQTNEAALNIMEDVQLVCSMEHDLNSIVEEVTSRDIELKSYDQLQKLTELVVDVYNNTRLWSNRGYTPVELRAFRPTNHQTLNHQPINHQPPNNVIPLHKPGRNDPCYCGSGKKYKKCCGLS